MAINGLQVVRTDCLQQGCRMVDAAGALCKGCGFDAAENRRRRELLRTKGLTYDPGTGRWGLRLQREGSG